jgi:DHA1 family inner membrane transport protein
LRSSCARSSRGFRPRRDPPCPSPPCCGERDVLSSFALTFLSFAATFTVVAYLGPVVNRVTGFAGAAVGPFQACIGLGSILGVALGGRIADSSRLLGAIAGLFGLMICTLSGYSVLLASPGATSAHTIGLGSVILFGAAALFTLIP